MKKTENKDNPIAKKAAIMSIFPGIGQLYNKQYLKGLLFLFLFLIYIFTFKDLFNMGLWGIVTLGTELPRDNSIFLLAEGLIAIIVLCIGLFFYYLNIRDVYKVGEVRERKQKPNSLKESYHAVIEAGYPYLLSAPGLLLLIFSVVFPLMFSIALAFTNYDLYHSAPANLADWVGLGTFKKIFTVDIWRKTFFDVLGCSVIWTLVASTLHVALGVFLAILVLYKDVRFKKVFRTILVLPSDVPGFVTILVFSGLFIDSFGAVNNVILDFLNISPIPWFNDPTWSKIALLIMQGWLGFPYIFIVTTGTLQSIPEDLYEAATIDGASALQKLKNITLPLILYSMAPIIITQYTFNFNNFNIIYLFNSGGPAVPGSTAGGTDILVSWIYKLTMQNRPYALAAALTILLSIFVVGIALWQFKRTNSFKEES